MCKLFRVIEFVLSLVFVIIYSRPHSFAEETCAKPGPLIVKDLCLSLFCIFVFASVFIFVFVLYFQSYVRSRKKKRLQGQAYSCSWSYAPHGTKDQSKVCKFAEQENDSLRNCRTNPSTNRCVLVTWCMGDPGYNINCSERNCNIHQWQHTGARKKLTVRTKSSPKLSAIGQSFTIDMTWGA